MGCCCRKKEETKNDSIKAKGSIKDDYKVKNNYEDNNGEKNIFEYANYIADNNINKNTGTNEENSFDNENNRDKEENNKDNFENKKNSIIAEINIDHNSINKYIRIINTLENNKRFYGWADREDDDKYSNEEEIKDNCIIKINDKIIPFNYYYKFNKIGNFKIEYLFKKKNKKYSLYVL